jgi:6-phosphogluconolactonase/glucosamine-6-phosphate isomerase/deaminase
MIRTPSGAELFVFDDAAQLAQRDAQNFADIARQACAVRGRCNVALAGGSTPSVSYRLLGEDDPNTAARTYADILCTEMGALPRFDLIMLGMGPDGHTASLFPGTDPLTDDELLVRAPYVEKMKTYRITLTPQVINAARRIAIATAGDEKADALAKALEGPYDPTTIPIQIVQPVEGILMWLVDRAAAAKLATVRATPAAAQAVTSAQATQTPK